MKEGDSDRWEDGQCDESQSSGNASEACHPVAFCGCPGSDRAAMTTRGGRKTTSEKEMMRTETKMTQQDLDYEQNEGDGWQMAKGSGDQKWNGDGLTLNLGGCKWLRNTVILGPEPEGTLQRLVSGWQAHARCVGVTWLGWALRAMLGWRYGGACRVGVAWGSGWALRAMLGWHGGESAGWVVCTVSGWRGGRARPCVPCWVSMVSHLYSTHTRKHDYSLDFPDQDSYSRPSLHPAAVAYYVVAAAATDVVMDHGHRGRGCRTWWWSWWWSWRRGGGHSQAIHVLHVADWPTGYDTCNNTITRNSKTATPWMM
ncbi:hypothetical protein EDB83DRAFT_2310400 [Lactarius deliciosus]|nr:hypothetical protein EDB83DRAFT_2310400 [Lactarius deliciosus]